MLRDGHCYLHYLISDFKADLLTFQKHVIGKLINSMHLLDKALLRVLCGKHSMKSLPHAIFRLETNLCVLYICHIL